MKEAIFPIGIKSESVSQSAAHPEITLGNLLFDEIADTYPNFGAYLRKVANSQPNEYTAGIGFMYDLVSEAVEAQNLSITISSDDLDFHKFNRRDTRIYKITSSDINLYVAQLLPGNPEPLAPDGSPLNDFMARIYNSSSEVFARFTSTLRDELPEKNKAAYLRGVYDTFMPFYRKVEADYLSTTLYRDEYPPNLPKKEMV